METLIPLDSGEHAVIIPRLTMPAKSHHNDDAGSLVFELRAYGKRQRLGSYEWDIEGPYPLKGANYLSWAGDLDGDGKLDLIMNHAAQGWHVTLYLSSLAEPGRIVGEAGSFIFWPPDASGC